MDERIEDILDECLDAVLNGGVDIEDAVARYPGHEAGLRPLVRLAVESREALRVEAPRESFQTTKARVMEGVREAAARRTLEQQVVSSRPRRRFGLKPLAWITAAFMLLSSGTALAASSAGPDSLLYPLKQRMEEARTGMTRDDLDKARREAGYAGKRLDEIADMAAKGKPELIPDLVYRYELHLDKAIGYANQAEIDGKDSSEVYAMIDDLQARFASLLGEIQDQLPEEIRRQLFAGGASGSMAGSTVSGGMTGRSPSPAGSRPGDSDYDDDDDHYGTPSGGEDDDSEYDTGGSSSPGSPGGDTGGSHENESPDSDGTGGDGSVGGDSPSSHGGAPADSHEEPDHD